jgi:hypothetical protein
MIVVGSLKLWYLLVIILMYNCMIVVGSLKLWYLPVVILMYTTIIQLYIRITTGKYHNFRLPTTIIQLYIRITTGKYHNFRLPTTIIQLYIRITLPVVILMYNCMIVVGSLKIWYLPVVILMYNCMIVVGRITTGKYHNLRRVVIPDMTTFTHPSPSVDKSYVVR